MARSKIIKLNEVRTSNTLALLEVLIRSGEISRVEMAKRLNCDNTTVTRAVRDLASRGLIESAGKKEAAFGRPQELLKLSSQENWLMGIALDARKITGVLTDFRGSVQNREQILFDPVPDRQKFLDAVSGIVKRLRDHAGSKLCGAGIATFGSYVDDRFTITNAVQFPQLNGVSLLDFFENEQLGDAVIADKLTSSLVYLLRCGEAELRQGTTLLLYAGSGIGMALALDGRILLARRNHGGELGHTLADPDGELCACGRRGCLETVASADALLRRINGRNHAGWDLIETGRQLALENAVAVEEVQKTAFHLGAAAADRINTLFPDHLVFSGPLTCLGKPFQTMLLTEIRQRLFPLSASPLSIHFEETPAEDEIPAAVGAALMAGEKLLNDFSQFNVHCPSRQKKSPADCRA